MSESRIFTAFLLLTVLIVAIIALVVYPPEDEPKRFPVLALLRIEGAQAGFSNTTTFRVLEEYERLGFGFNISEAAHVRASVTDPNGTVHEAQPIAVEDDHDRLELNVPEPPLGTWRFTIWTLDDEERQGYIVSGDFWILGIGADVAQGG